MSNRAAEYRGLIDDVMAGGLLEEDEWQHLKDVMARVQRRLMAKQPDKPVSEDNAA